jgi:hypothetical protein
MSQNIWKIVFLHPKIIWKVPENCNFDHRRFWNLTCKKFLISIFSIQIFFVRPNFNFFYHPNYSLRVLFQMFLGCHINIFQMFWGDSRQFSMTSGATIPMFLECFGGSTDYSRWHPEQLYQCFSSVLRVSQTTFHDFQINYTKMSRVLWEVSGLLVVSLIAEMPPFHKICVHLIINDIRSLCIVLEVVLGYTNHIK